MAEYHCKVDIVVLMLHLLISPFGKIFPLAKEPVENPWAAVTPVKYVYDIQ